jgi:quercetin dioxygenase-like cupin family protein
VPRLIPRYAGLLVCVAAAACSKPAATSGEVKRTLLASADLADMPGFESRLFLIEYPPGAAAKPHVHTEQDIGYVIDGRFEAEFGDAPVMTGQAGDGFVEGAHAPHRFRNPDAGRPLRFVIAGTYRKDEPIFLPVDGSPDFLSTAVGPPSAASARRTGQPLREPTRTLLAQREIADLPGMESRIYLVEFPPGAESKVHTHPVQGVGYVLEGSFESSFGDGPATVKHAGEAFVDVPGQPHHFRNADSARPLRFVFAGTFHKNDPLIQVLAQ